MSDGLPDIVPGLEDFWVADESLDAMERDVMNKPPKFGLSHEQGLPYGITYRGPWETANDGVCIAVRRNACALRRAGIPVFLTSFSHMHWNNGIAENAFYKDLPRSVLDEVDHLTELEFARNVGFIHHFVPSTDTLMAQVAPSRIPGGEESRESMLGHTAAYVALEYDKIPEAWIACLNRFACVIVPCRANATWLKECGLTKPVHVVPHPTAINDPIRAVSKHLEYKGGMYEFLQIGKWEPRKNQHAGIGAFLMAFGPDDEARLNIKTSPFWRTPDYPSTVSSSVEYWLRSPEVKAKGWNGANVGSRLNVIWNRSLTREEMVKLYSRCHCYLQLGRSEGFDLPAFDARIAGLRLVAMAHGGPADFVGEDDVRIPTFRMAPPPDGYKAPDGTLWPEPALSVLKGCMRQAYDDRHEYKAQPLDWHPYTIDRIGMRLREIMIPIAADLGMDLQGYRA